MPADLRIAVVGGGIGGLTLALALAARDVPCTVYEQASEHREIGAGVALSANATRHLLDLGLGDALDAVAVEPSALVFRRWDDGAVIAAHPMRDHYREAFGAPYYGVHRVAFQKVLADALVARSRQAEWTSPSWNEPCDVEDAVAAYDGWHPAVTEMVGAVAEGNRWALHDHAPLERWHAGRVVLIGDAAHAMLPHQGQGANQTIEDAVLLADLLADARADAVEAALERYEALRAPRTRRVQRWSRLVADWMHLPDGPAAERRNVRMRLAGADLAWIHDYDVLAARAAPAAGAGRSCAHP